MANVKDNAASQETRRKLIDAAGQVFAERGLHAATLQEITDRAGVNKAAVNYHFRDKFELYAAVVRYCVSFRVEPSPEEMTGPPRDCLRALIAHIIREILDPTKPAWRAAIINHELAQPTAALDAVMDELIAPRSRLQLDIVRRILGPRASEEKVVRTTLSIIAQCLVYLHDRRIMVRLHPILAQDDQKSDEIARHIADFSLAALRPPPRRRPSPKPKRRS
ncbi:MAG: CerR family C-terminal domain-containing protein [Planctomycetes bacterium]|jgi:AcrR family transcriptional regulator|nr:CerR family C-terminal domain-containing protein [Planctomycetota bacterium]